MPSGNSVESQFVRHAPLRKSIVRLLPLALAALSLAWLLRSGPVLRILAVATKTLLGNSALRPVLYGIAGLLFFFLLRTIIWLTDMAIRAATLRHQMIAPPTTTVEQFLESAKLLHIDLRIAREAFQLLAELVPDGPSIDLQQDLRSDLGLSEQETASLLAALPELCDRARTPADISSIVTVYDLLHHIESAPAWTPGQLNSRIVAPVPPPSQLPASPLADLKNASPRDSRFRTRAHFSGMKRRASDYSGPFRRATDRRPDANYSGPLRRASDRQDRGAQMSESSERHIAERRIADRRIPPAPIAPPLPAQHAPEEARQHRVAAPDTSLLGSALEHAREPRHQGIDCDVLPSAITQEKSNLTASGFHRR